MRRMDNPSRFKTSHVRIALIVAVLAAMGIAASSASAYIYVAGPVTNWLYGPNPNPSTIERLTLDGSAVQPNFISPTRANWGIQVQGDRIYWLDYPGGHDCNVKSALLDGTDVETLASIDVWGCSSASMAITNGYLYWGSASGLGKIGRVSLQPPYDVQPDFIHLPPVFPTSRFDEHGSTESLVTDGSWLYWYDTERKAVGRARVDGTDLEPSLFEPEPPTAEHGALNAELLGVAQGYLWWRTNWDTGSIGRAGLDGTDPERRFLTGIHIFAGALTPEWLYYTGSPCPPQEGEPPDWPESPGCVNINGAVRRVALAPGATPQLIAQGLGQGVGYAIGVDSRGALFPSVQITKHGDGTATAAVSTPRPAKVSVDGRQIIPAAARYRDSKVARVAIRPGDAAVSALQANGAARVRVRLHYRPQGGLPRTQRRALTLHLDGHG